MFSLFISAFQLSSVWSSHPMTDETVGPELPAATGGWTNGLTRGGACIRNRLLRPGGMLGWGREQARALPPPPPALHPSGVTSGLPAAVIIQLSLLPWERKGWGVRLGAHLILLLLQTVMDVTPCAEDR